jgi:pimeloyl-ACP methyl ester carboxylesterase
MNYAYLHGFASSPQSEKGQQLADMLAEDGIDLHLPDLNQPSFEELTYSNMVEAMQAYDREHGDGEPWRIIGSSMGGYVAARWAEIAPGKVDRMVLLCPGFDMVNRWVELLGEESVERWREEGTFLFFDPEDSLSAIHWELYADADENHPPYPEVDCPVIVIHGSDDEIVPLASSKKFVDQTDGAELRVVDDNHKLHGAVDEIAGAARELFEL